ncbi:hypothetical protein [Cupriavidus sp. RAF12]|uniref:hypothetical protein n=1 Tax=Cupriavidus sp. RAF12 TaxID=3233050 RepID=UPI003F90A60A
MRAFDPTVSDYTKALSQGQSPRAIANARARVDVAYGRMQRFEQILATTRHANALSDVLQWMQPVQVEPAPKPVDAKLLALREHFEGRRHR